MAHVRDLHFACASLIVLGDLGRIEYNENSRDVRKATDNPHAITPARAGKWVACLVELPRRSD